MRRISRLRKKERQEKVLTAIKENPFLSDGELARLFSVSIQTIRLDRLELSIPELRERIKSVAEQKWDPLKSLQVDEVVGELIELKLNNFAVSLFEVKEEHVFSRTQVARGHHIFAQANSLAVAVVDAEVVLTGSAKIRYLHPVKLGEKLIARAEALTFLNGQVKVRVDTTVNGKLVFNGTFRVFKAVDKQR